MINMWVVKYAVIRPTERIFKLQTFYTVGRSDFVNSVAKYCTALVTYWIVFGHVLKVTDSCDGFLYEPTGREYIRRL